MTQFYNEFFLFIFVIIYIKNSTKEIFIKIIKTFRQSIIYMIELNIYKK